MAKEKTSNAADPNTNPVADTVDLSEWEGQGFIRLNPEPRYYNVDGAGPLQCVVIDRASMPSRKKAGESNAYYTCIAMKRCANGPVIDAETGDVHEQRDIEPGDTIRVGARHQIDDTFPKVCGKAAMVLVKPLRKVTTSNNRTVWQFAIMARKLSGPEREKLAQFSLSDFDDI